MRAFDSSIRPCARALVIAAITWGVLGVAACDKASHENLDKWMSTEKGPGKLKATLASSEQDVDLRAHAGQNLVLMDRFAEVREIVENLAERERADLMAKLAPRLWDSARFKQGQDILTMPSPDQNMAKDALFDLRAQAGPETRSRIDEWLVEWLAGGYFEGRAKEGRIPGREIIRAIGKVAAPRLLDSARSIIAKPPSPDGSRIKVGDELLKALALTGDPQAIGFVLDLSVGDFQDETLGKRATEALWEAFVQPPTGVEALSARDGLLPHMDRLLTMVRSEDLAGAMINDAADLIAAIGPPECLQPFLDMVSYPHAVENKRWMGTQKAVRCAGTDAIGPMLESIPTNVDFDRGRLEKYVWKEILAINAKTKVAEAARALLASRSWVARVTGIEVLGAIATRDSATQDAKHIRALAGDRKLLKGWWGKSAAEKKPDPTLGKVAVEVASRLEALAKGSEIK